MKKVADGEPWTMPATIDEPATLDEIGTALKGKGIGDERRFDAGSFNGIDPTETLRVHCRIASARIRTVGQPIDLPAWSDNFNLLKIAASKFGP
jgi:hypothetical protein